MINARKVVIFKGIIDSLDAFAEELSIGFEKEGLDVLMVMTCIIFKISCLIK